MGEIRLTKAQHEAMRKTWEDVGCDSDPEYVFFISDYYPGTKEYVRFVRVHNALVDIGLLRGTDEEYSLTESGLAYCKKHFTTTEQP